MYKSAFLTDLDESLGGIRSVRMHQRTQSAGFWKSLNFQVNQQQCCCLFALVKMNLLGWQLYLLVLYLLICFVLFIYVTILWRYYENCRRSLCPITWRTIVSFIFNVPSLCSISSFLFFFFYSNYSSWSVLRVLFMGEKNQINPSLV